MDPRRSNPNSVIYIICYTLPDRLTPAINQIITSEVIHSQAAAIAAAKCAWAEDFQRLYGEATIIDNTYSDEAPAIVYELHNQRRGENDAAYLPERQFRVWVWRVGFCGDGRCRGGICERRCLRCL